MQWGDEGVVLGNKVPNYCSIPCPILVTCTLVGGFSE